MSAKRKTNPVGVPPGHWTSEELEPIETTMNATIRECVFVTEFLDSGSAEDALEALLQIKLNAEQVIEKIERKMNP